MTPSLKPSRRCPRLKASQRKRPSLRLAIHFQIPRAERRFDGGLRYLGRLVEGKPHGMGTMMYPDGDRFEGYFEHGLKMGQGKMTLASGHTFDGFWVRDRLNGLWCRPQAIDIRARSAVIISLKAISVRDGDQYSGQFAMGKPQGQGVLVFGRTSTNAPLRTMMAQGAVFADGTIRRNRAMGMVGMFTGRGASQQGAPADREQQMKRPYRPR